VRRGLGVERPPVSGVKGEENHPEVERIASIRVRFFRVWSSLRGSREGLTPR
jgi:hypothetical protein